ncbi:forespore capture DNA-binding protein RefZ [Bacillus taeanensis]|uniref:TetR family transcriptional regulator n=1 Tax=Bacillus taeanensis TaxID=273032 RepID=A0A366Y4V8_9BACI|nr:forespore capture DNA-binding protein RefZ [Bacillus taeanensis]RBW71453.1 TetR family transcriptional regulator [Bacillus taeanensis]
MEESITKQKVIEAAIALFNSKGYNGTSVREIAYKAKVNISLISYYFGGKQGLLEDLIAAFFEGYVAEIESSYQRLETISAKKCLQEIILKLLSYQQNHHHLARFVHREITLDTILVREVMTTYLRKEKYYFKEILVRGSIQNEFKKQPVDYVIMQLKGMLIMPYLHPQYLNEVYYINAYEEYFKERYTKLLMDWIDFFICRTHGIKKQDGMPSFFPVLSS